MEGCVDRVESSAWCRHFCGWWSVWGPGDCGRGVPGGGGLVQVLNVGMDGVWGEDQASALGSAWPLGEQLMDRGPELAGRAMAHPVHPPWVLRTVHWASGLCWTHPSNSRGLGLRLPRALLLKSACPAPLPNTPGSRTSLKNTMKWCNVLGRKGLWSTSYKRVCRGTGQVTRARSP